MKRTILFLCGHNAGRSQMAETYFNHINESTTVRAISAGTNPADEINKAAKKILTEEGVDTYHLVPKLLTPQMVDENTTIITMGCNVDCSAIPFNIKISEDWNLEDPDGKDEASVKNIFNQIKEKVSILNQSLKWTSQRKKDTALHPRKEKQSSVAPSTIKRSI